MNNATQTMEQIIESMNKAREEKAEEADSTRSDLMQKMLPMNIVFASIEFSGSGDSGSIDQVVLVRSDGSTVSSWGSENSPTSEEKDLMKELEEFADNYLEGVDVDWYNGEGGQGEVEFDLKKVPFAFRASVDQNETVSNNVFSTEEVL